MNIRFYVETRHLTALQRRLATGDTDRPFAVVDKLTGAVVGRYGTRTGADRKAERMNR